MASKGSHRAMVVTDLDGTLFQRERRISPKNLEALNELASLGVLRVIATGRNLFSARKILPTDFPIDVLIFSSGAGIMDWVRQRLLRKVSLNRFQLLKAFLAMEARELDFMVHRPIPENHRFVYFTGGRENPDFEARCELYREFAVPGRRDVLPMSRACQLLAVESPVRSDSAYEGLKQELAAFTVLRTTSPLDGHSRWIEVFSPLASKALAASWISRRSRIPPQAILAVGNDYNDLDLLEWAPHRYLVGGSPPELGVRFPVLRCGDESDFAQAVSLWICLL